ncbi:MAG: hypothetical protein QOE46_174 [Acidobacteriota bacterium]|jgi:hypothetical protein|nr:hypothetical protein [Acidobacteriota bacterium]
MNDRHFCVKVDGELVYRSIIGIGSMRNRLLSIGTLLLALLLSAWGNVLAAVTCAHMEQDHACCHARVAHHPASHQGMDEMQMDDTQTMHGAEQSADIRALGQTAGACEHCMGRSQLPTPPATLREADQSKRGEDVSAPLAISEPLSITISFVPLVLAREHAPPTAVSSSRHILISVFRI